MFIVSINQAYSKEIGSVLPLELRKITHNISYDEYCSRNSCSQYDAIEIIKFDKYKNILYSINANVNNLVTPGFDIDEYNIPEYWALLRNNNFVGDCEDIALEKRQQLIENGVNPNSLKMATAFHNKKFFGHAVLIVITDRGNFVLDEFNNDIMHWDKTPYIFEKVETYNGLFEYYFQDW